jgi:hypothetical protein
MSQYDVMNLIAGKLKRDGFWEKIGALCLGSLLAWSKGPSESARAVPGRRVRSVHDHARSLFATHRDPKKWTDQTDWRLMK